MKIYVVGERNIELEKLNKQRNEIFYVTLLEGILRSFCGKGRIIYSKEKNGILEFCQKLLKTPYLFGEISNILEFENHYSRIKKYEIPVLMYHQFVENKKDGGKIKLFVTKKQFELHLRILKFFRYETITFEDLDRIGLQNRFYKKYIILTVDDGYKDNYEILYPLLKKYKMKAVIFLVSGLNYNKWTIESSNEKRFDLMNDNEVLKLQESGTVEFGGHTLTHLSFLDAEEEKAKYEIEEDKRITENRLNKILKVFAYPYGHRKEETKDMVKESGYLFAVSTDTGSGIITEDLFDIRRTAIDKTSLFDFIRKISPGYLQYKAKKYKNKKRNNI